MDRAGANASCIDARFRRSNWTRLTGDSPVDAENRRWKWNDDSPATRLRTGSVKRSSR